MAAVIGKVYLTKLHPLLNGRERFGLRQILNRWLHIQDFEAEAAFSLGIMKCSWMADSWLTLWL